MKQAKVKQILATLDWNKLILTTTFSIFIFSFHEKILFPRVSILTRRTFHKSKKPRMQTENLDNNSHKNFYVLLNLTLYSQIKLCTYSHLLKENPLLRKFLNSESTAYILDETFYHTHTTFLNDNFRCISH